MFSDLDFQCINTIRALSADMVQKANSGHPGMPLGMAPVAHVLWSKIMKFNAKNHKWLNRDRFVLSNGHGCALLYSMLHLSGYPLTLDDLKNFRQLHSKTPGHPECFMTEGVEVTTGPLGQGIANAVGLAIAESQMAASYNRDSFDLFNNFTYVFCGDGCLQEGVAAEAVSLAGHLKLNKLIVIYDDNQITIDGNTNLSFSEDIPTRFAGYGWNVSTVKDGNNDLQCMYDAITAAQKSDKPTIICLKTTIGYGTTKAGHHDVHGAPLGGPALQAFKQSVGMDPAQSFVIPEAVSQFYASVSGNNQQQAQQWDALFAEYSKQYPELATEIANRTNNTYPADWKSKLPQYNATSKADATRNISGVVLNAIADQLPWVVGGSADLTPSNKTDLKKSSDYSPANRSGRYIRFGVREHAMAAIGNGLHAYGGFIPFTATFLNFIEYCFPAVRLSALSHVQQLYIMTHDSIGLGEDGPTHQPIEAVAMCRATPNIAVFRPADGRETVGSYICAMENTHGPSVLALSRQNLPSLENSSEEAVAKGGYTVYQTKADAKPDLIYVSTGSEVSISINAAKLFTDLNVRVVSMPSTTLFDKQSVEYRSSVIIPGVPTIAVEALSTFGWSAYSHYQIGMTTFGASAPDTKVYEYFGLTPSAIHAKSSSVLATMKSMTIGALPIHF